MRQGTLSWHLCFLMQTLYTKFQSLLEVRQVASNLARAMVTRWGMSEAIGPITFGDGGGSSKWEVREEGYSQEVMKSIDAEVSKIITESLKSAEKVLKENKKALDAIAAKLVEVETLEQEEYEKIIGAFGILPKKKEEIKVV